MGSSEIPQNSVMEALIKSGLAEKQPESLFIHLGWDVLIVKFSNLSY